jgi:hypothetical protein
MNPKVEKAIERWKAYTRNRPWYSPIDGLLKYACFCGNYGFQIYGGFGWKRIHTLAFATNLQDIRKHGGNWKNIWKNRKYS